MKQLLFIATVFMSNILFAQNHYILALSKGEIAVVVYDYQTLDSITKIPVGDDPHEIVTNENGTLAYISKPLMNASGHEIAVVNLKTLQPEKIIDTKPFFIPHGLVYLNDKLWFTAQGSKVVGVYNINENKVEQVFGTGQDFTHLIHATADEKRFYTTNVESGTVSIYEKKEIPPYMPPTGVLPPNAKSRTEWRQTLINVGLGAEGFDVSSDGKELWTARPDGHIIVVDLVNKKVKADINSKVLGLHRLKITPDGNTVCIVSVKTGDLLFYNRQTHHLEKQMNIGQGAGIYIDNDNRMFVSCTPNNYISVIDLATRKEIKRLAIERPDGVTSVNTPVGN
ncbi:YncE family protein [Sphingobacterium siyangense]|uniref:DNA-binding beta-propeller fold protein YncE n=1 Tax=Sphingobacterium siyangense TaxID=459529 RepID=A0A562MH27_9SPHI|nr:YncE family protein [Sphingobacterium siyangense]TWI18841.1 DNA-binding beta-propeller fold protein YncE [Sphingobacterium siyangense]